MDSGSTCGAIAGAWVATTAFGGSGAVSVKGSESGGARGAGAAANDVGSVIDFLSGLAPTGQWLRTRRVHWFGTWTNLLDRCLAAGCVRPAGVTPVAVSRPSRARSTEMARQSSAPPTCLHPVG